MLRESFNSDLCEYTHSSIKNNYMNKPWYTRFTNATAMIGRSIYLYTSMIPRICQHSNFIFDPLKCKNTSDSWNWNNNTSGLYVIVHGLLGTPKLSALSIAKYIDTHYTNKYDIIVPVVPHKGNCSLEEASNPILNIILDFIDKNPNKPIHLIGSSNGGRIVAHLEISLRSLRPNSRVRVTGVGGVYYGSNSLYYLRLIGLAQLILHKDIIKNLTTGSDHSTQLINSMQFDQSIKRSYEFYATANDWYIPNFDSCYPVLHNTIDVKYHEPVTGVDHVLLGHYLAPHIIEDSVKWMENNAEY